MSKKGAKTQSQNKEQTYEVRDIVLAKVRGFPPWPGMVSPFSISRRAYALHAHSHATHVLTSFFLNA